MINIDEYPKGDKSSVIRLLQYGAKIDEKSPDGNTALMFAVNKGEFPLNDASVRKKTAINRFVKVIVKLSSCL